MLFLGIDNGASLHERTAMEPKFCKDCNKYMPSTFYPSCADPNAEVCDFVNGTYRQMYCDAMREHKCGPDAKLFEAKK